MSVPNWYAVFKAEYYTTTANFRAYRKWIPFFFLIGIFFFSYLIRASIDFVVGENFDLTKPPINQFYSIISIFTFFTLFAPIISPLGRVVYDGSAKARIEVALSSPVKSHELLYGNLISNLVFFLPFYVLVGTISLSFFIGNGVFSPLFSSILLLAALVLLIILGLFSGTLVTPLIINIIGKQRNDVSRAIVTLFVAFMLMLALPLLQFLMQYTKSHPNDLGIIGFLPFTIGASIIIYGLYGVTIGLSVTNAFVLLIVYNIVIIILGYFVAERLYNMDGTSSQQIKIVQDSWKNKALKSLSRVIPDSSIRSIFQSMVKSSFRDLEHLSRLSIGLASTVFFLYALSGRGLFQDNQNFTGDIQNAVVLFSLILSASTTIYIEAASFTVQNKSMLTMIKSSPGATKKFVIAKVLQMLVFQVPIFAVLLLAINYLNFADSLNVISFTIQLFVIIFSLIMIMVGIFLINPADNEEDLTNFINLLLFYVIALFIAIFPIAQVITDFANEVQLIIYFIGILILSLLLLIGGIFSLEQMDIETLSSPFQKRIKTIFSGILLTLISFNVLPLFSLTLFFATKNITILLIGSSLSPLIIPAIYFYKRKRVAELKFNIKNKYLYTLAVYILMLATGFVVIRIIPISAQQASFNPVSLISTNITYLILFIIIFTLIEELFFREFLFSYFQDKGYSTSSVVVPSIVFATFHIYFAAFVNALFSGFLLAFLRKRNKNVLYPILAHLTYNISILVISIS